MRLDPDSLHPAEWETIAVIEREPTGPSGALWAPGTSLLVKLVAWAGWGLHVAEQAGLDEPEAQAAVKFAPDGLSRGNWETVRAVERERVGPGGDPWPEDASTLERLAAWAHAGRFLLGADREDSGDDR